MNSQNNRILRESRRGFLRSMAAGSAIPLLPALPTVWTSGKVTGLHARGGFVVDQTWENGQLTDIEVHSTVGGICHLRYGTHIGTFETKPGKSYHINHELKLL